MSTIRFLRTFLAVEKHGSLAAAADRVALTQAAVGQQMRALEDELRRPLFDRSRRVVTLTPAGRALIPHARRVVAAYEAMLAETDAPEAIAGTITVGAIVSAMGFLSENVIALKAHHPALEVRLELAPSGRLAERVYAGELDAALVVKPHDAVPVRAQWTPLYEEPLMLLASTRVASPHADVAALLKSCPFIRFDRQSETGTKIEQTLRRMRVKPNDVLEVNSVAAIVDLVRQNVGIAIVPLLKHVAWARDRSVVPLALPHRPPARIVGMVESGSHPAITGAVRQQLLQAIG
ncbi:LysR family transcriptional regulator [Paraburkholderia flava]|uniref:LysR family transcriptional regulator n=1 Tax=Paraburkholderia flava TaxID=2547393 RepID=UPI001061CC3D|nr:LysR family transcriptional regulator [Paraburkholderia flava]